MAVRGIISPPRFRFSPRERRPYNLNNNAAINPPSKPNYTSPFRRPINNNNTNQLINPSHRKETTTHNHRSSIYTSRLDPTKPTSKIVSSKPQTATPNPKHKKLHNNSTTKFTSRPSSPRTAKPISQLTRPTPSKSNVKGGIAIGSSSRSDLCSSAAKPSAIEPNHLGRLDHRCSAGHYATLQGLHVPHQLRRLSIIDDKDLANMVLHANSIYESMGSDTKEESSSQSNDSRMFQIYKEIASHRQENSSITSYFTKLEALWNELATFNTDLPQCSCGGSTEKLSEYMERERAMQFLVGLNDSYSKICNQILLTTPFPTVEKAYYAIIREEKRRELLSALETVAEKVIQNNWLDLQNQNAHSNNGDYYDGVQGLVDSNNLHQQQFDQTLVTSFPMEPLLIDLGSPVR